MRTKSAFSLLEVMVAMAILTVGLVSLLQVQARSAQLAIEGRELTVTVMGDRALAVTEITSTRGFYDYQAKYFSAETRYLCPCGLPAEGERELADIARAAFDAVGARGWGRVDIMVSPQAGPLILEINTVPGMTSHSLVPMAAGVAGTGFDDLVWQILETSLAAVPGVPA